MAQGGTHGPRVRSRLAPRHLVRRASPRGGGEPARAARPASTYGAGTEILREGDPTSALGIVASGRVALRLRVPERGPTTVLTVRGRQHHRLVGGGPAASGHLHGRDPRPDRAAVPRRRGAAGRTRGRPGPRRGGLSHAARGDGAPPARDAHAAARPVRASTETTRGDRDRSLRPSCPARTSVGCSTSSTRMAAGSSARPSTRVPSSTTRSPRPPTCRPAGRRPRRPGHTVCGRPARTGRSTSSSARRPGSRRRSRRASR